MKHMIFLKSAAIGVIAGLTLNVYAQEIGIIRYEVNPEQKHQTISNFSASDAWSVQQVGLWPKEKTEKMADWLFSTEMDKKGNPKGIGLSMWRFYIGSGSAEQGDSSQINKWTRTECFLKPDGTYDWNKQAGQRNFLKLASQRGVNQFLGFTYSVPVYWSANGLATNTGRGGTFNIKQDKYEAFAGYLANVVQGIEQHDGIKLSFLCPFNEPDGHWNWLGPKQEGTPATNREIAKTVRLTGNEFARRKINTEILVSESSDLNCIFRNHPQTGSDRTHQVQSFFCPDSTETYIGNVPNVPKRIVGHSYWTNTPLDTLRNIRREMNDVLKKLNVNFWETELCIMSNDEEIGGGGGIDLTMKTALYVARVIHHDLVYANASAWQWWLAVSTGNYRDGLIYAHPDRNRLDGTITDSKLMWILGNYSRFIRPGAVRLSINAYNSKGILVPEGETNPHGIMISSYENTDKTRIAVVINYQNESHTINLVWKGQHPKYWKPYITSDASRDNLAPHSTVLYGKPITIPARSVVTLVDAGNH